MEYLRFHAEYDDVPIEEITAAFVEHYAGTIETGPAGNFDEEIEKEAGAGPPDSV
jgi:hypothetical protein